MSILVRKPSRSASPAALLRSRVARTPDAPLGPGWKALSGYYTELAHERADREDVIVRVSPGASPEAPGFWQPSTARIALDGTLLPESPEAIDASRPDHFRALATLHGVFVHECGHARHTNGTPASWPREIAEQIALLEEIRMEARAVEDKPSDARWLRASATAILMDAESVANAANSALAGAAHAATLTLGRVHAGSLKAEDVKAMEGAIADVIDADTRSALESIWRETVALRDDDAEGMAALARRYRDLMPADEGGMSGDLAQAIADALAESGASASGSASDELAEDEGAHEEATDGLGDAREAANSTAESDKPSDPADGLPSHGHSAASGKKVTHGERPPSDAERAARNRLAERLRRARFRQRATTKVGCALPPGRLRTGQAVRAAAESSQGRLPSAKPWKRTKRRQIEQPRIHLSLLVDASGSMGGREDGLSAALWVIANAVTDAHGRCAAGAFGDAYTPLAAPDQPPRKVMTFPADGGTECITEGLAETMGQLDILNAVGPRLVVIVSDGHWSQAESRNAQRAMESFRALGIATIQVGIGAMPRQHGADVTCVISGTDDLVSVVGPAIEHALSVASEQ